MTITVEYKDNEYILDILSPMDKYELDSIQEEWENSISASIDAELDIDWIVLFTDILERKGIKYKHHSLGIDRTFRF